MNDAQRATARPLSYSGWRLAGSANVYKQTRADEAPNGVVMLSPARSMLVYHHASTFDWGNTSEPAAQLALAILLEHFEGDVRVPVYLHLKFRDAVVAKMPDDRWELTAARIEDFIKTQLEEKR